MISRTYVISIETRRKYYVNVETHTNQKRLPFLEAFVGAEGFEPPTLPM